MPFGPELRAEGQSPLLGLAHTNARGGGVDFGEETSRPPMKISAFCAALVSLFLSAAAPADPLVYVAIATHNEDMANANTPDTPLASSLIDYSNFRRGIFYFANTLNTLCIPWNWQSEWNFPEGCRQWKIASPQIFPDNTGGLNIVRWLRETRGVECNAHSHEGYGYNYADVAWMLRTYFAVPDSHLNTVGGVIYASNHPNFLHLEKFCQTNGDGTTGLQPPRTARAFNSSTPRTFSKCSTSPCPRA